MASPRRLGTDWAWQVGTPFITKVISVGPYGTLVWGYGWERPLETPKAKYP